MPLNIFEAYLIISGEMFIPSRSIESELVYRKKVNQLANRELPDCCPILRRSSSDMLFI